MSAETVTLPVARAERIELLDILRGFALLGILLVNFWGSAGKLIPTIDGAVDAGLGYLISGSFYPLYSFLFGLGFAIQLLRAREKGTGIVGVYFRRMLALLLIGTAHVVLVWDGDILVNYALLGLLLIPLYRLPARALLATIVLLFAYQMANEPIHAALAGWRNVPAEVQNANALRAADTAERRAWRDAINTPDSGVEESYATSVTGRWRVYSGRIANYANWQRFVIGSDLLLIFLIGLYAGRKRWLQDAGVHRKRFAVVAFTALALGVGGAIFDGPVSDGNEILENIAYTVANWGFTIFYIAGITFLVTGAGRAARKLRVFAPAGMMGLTNYLLQSLVMTWPFLSYGLGLPRPSTTLWVLVNLAFFFLVQVPLSAWWMRRFRFGPAEWLWRSLTYGALQPMRRGAPPVDTEKLEPALIYHT